MTATPPAPQVGQPFPSLTFLTVKNQPVRVPEDFRGQTVVLSWYPFAFSPVCTEEFTGFTKVHQDFGYLNATVVAVSCDHWYTTEAYKRSLGAPWPFVSDWERTEARKLGVFNEERHRPDRHIFILDKAGVLRWHRFYPRECPSLDDFLPVLKELA